MKKKINLAVCTTAGIILDVTIPPDVEKYLAENTGWMPIHFLAGVGITNYMIAPSYETELRVKYGPGKSADIINRMKAYLDSKKAKRIAPRQGEEYHALRLD